MLRDNSTEPPPPWQESVARILALHAARRYRADEAYADELHKQGLVIRPDGKVGSTALAIKPPDLEVLRIIVQGGGVLQTATELAGDVHCDPTNVAPRLQRLAALSLVERNGQRSGWIATDAGREYVTTLDKAPPERRR